MDHYQFLFEAVPAPQKEVLIALLADIGFNGFEEEGESLKAFIETDYFDAKLFENIIENTGVKYCQSTIYQTNWNANWESGFNPVIVLDPKTGEPFALVRANFHAAIPGVKHDLIITPKMSFGTGHHATTYLMIEQMSRLDLRGKSVIDFGTGTGVLAILAEKLGAASVLAIDNDDWSIENARENIAANQCSRIRLAKADSLIHGEQVDLVLANINLNVIIANLDAVLAVAKPGANILLSGILAGDKEQLIHALKEKNIREENCLLKDNWLAVCAKG